MPGNIRSSIAIWQTHLFREGNTRSVVAFSVLLASKLGVKLDFELFASHAAYVRNALVWCTQGIYSIYDYLERIYFDAAGLLDEQPEQTAAKQKDTKWLITRNSRILIWKSRSILFKSFDTTVSACWKTPSR